MERMGGGSKHTVELDRRKKKKSEEIGEALRVCSIQAKERKFQGADANSCEEAEGVEFRKATKARPRMKRMEFSDQK